MVSEDFSVTDLSLAEYEFQGQNDHALQKQRRDSSISNLTRGLSVKL